MLWTKLFHCPMIREAIEANGDNPETVSIKAAERRPDGRMNGYTSCSENIDKPYIDIHEEGGAIEWPGSQIMLLIEQKNSEFIFVLEIINIALPEAIFRVLKERNLKSAIDIPGAEHYKIKAITNCVIVNGPATCGKVDSFPALNIVAPSFKVDIEMI